jgi:phage tail sheath gpL-like
MGIITDNSIAAGLGVKAKNVVLQAAAAVMPRKILIIATPNAAQADSVPINQPFLVLSPEDVASRAGSGGMAHRLALASFRGSRSSVPTYLMLEADNESAVAATGSVALTATTHGAGTLSLYIAGTLYAITVAAPDTITQIGDKIAAAVSKDSACPVSAVNAAGTVTFTAKSKGPWGNGITIALNQRPGDGETTPSGITAAITAMTGGAGLPGLAADLPLALGAGDSANEARFTDVLHGYGKETVVLNALSQYVGEGNENVALYSDTVARPVRSLIADVSTASTALADLIAFTDARKLDRTSGIVARPGSLTHPSEIAAETVGYMAFLNADYAELGYCDAVLSGVDPGLIARSQGKDWTTEYANRDLAVHSGISPTIVSDGAVKLQNVVSFYRPSNLPETSWCFRRMRDISLVQNIIYNYKQVFGSEKWTNFTVVENTANVQNAKNRAKARDTEMVKDDLLSLITGFTSMAWLFSAAPSVAGLKKPEAVTLRENSSGFNTKVPYVLSGEGNILNNEVDLDTSFAIMATL